MQTAQSAVCSYTFAEFVFHCLPNAPLPSLSSEKERILYGGFNVTLSHERTGFCTLPRFFVSSHCTPFSFTMIFLFNWLVSSSSSSSSTPFFSPSLTGLSLSEKKTQRGSPWHFSFFILFHSLPRSSISPSLSSLLSLYLLSPLAFRKMRSAVVL